MQIRNRLHYILKETRASSAAMTSQLAITFSKLTTETLEHGVKYFQS